DRLAEAADASGQAAQTVSVGRRSADLDLLAQLIEQAEVETLAAEIQSGVQHCVGPPFVSRGRAEHDSAGGPPSSHSFARRNVERSCAAARARSHLRARKGRPPKSVFRRFASP